ncbi:VCBS repeat-containing protein, partial [Patescibacteria group bacterium]|nr:VCBS repeat-containing protein [Patescibacteria group bacterium]
MVFFITPLLVQAQTFTADDITGDLGASRAVFITDLNGDTYLDIYVGNNGQNRLWINDGSGNFTSNGISGDTGFSLGVAYGDVNGDTYPDIYVANYSSEQNKLWINDGSGNFTANNISGDLGLSRSASIGDVNGDTYPDIYVTNYGAQNKLWINDGSGNFTAGDISGDLGDSLYAVSTDLNGDTYPDIYVANFGQNKLWINDGSGNFSADDITGDTGNSTYSSVGDLNGDTYPDIYVANYSSAQNKLWINDGSGNFSANDISGDLGNSFSGILGDVNSDTYLDVYVTNKLNEQNKLWINDGSGNFTANNISGDLGNSSQAAFGDVDGDTYLDIYVANDSDEQNKLWINHGETNFLLIENLNQYQMFQRDEVGQSDITISGSYGGSCSSVEASFNGGSYAVIDASPSGSTFSGTLADQAVGQGALAARCANNTSINDSVLDIGIGDVFVIAGQSNAVGKGETLNSYTHATLKAVAFDESDSWIKANDPIDIETSDGSPWPLVASNIMSDQNVPTAFITTARSGTGLVANSDWLPPSGPQYVNMLQQIDDSGVNGVKAVLWYQGEADSFSAIPKADYNNALDLFATEIKADVVGAPSIVVGQVGEQVPGRTREGIDNIRLAQSEAWDDNSDIFAGPSTYDIELTIDGLHFQTDLEIQTLADRWWAAIDEALYNGTKGRGPKFVSASENSTRTEIIVDFENVETTLLPATGIEGFRVEDDDVAVSISSVDRLDADSVTITLASALSGTATVSLGSGNDLGNLTDSSTYNLPAETFVDESVNLYVDTVPPTITLLGTTPVNVNQNDTYTDAGATCTDDIDPTCTVTTVNPVDTAT